jgi:AcrR family transcriptional regulator
MTPWGESGTLRERRLPPGRSIPRPEARKNQRERLLAAMVASSELRGYEDTSVADLLEISGVSRATFYDHFEDKMACFTAAIEQILQDGTRAISAELAGEGEPEQRASGALEAFLKLVASQPAASRMCLVEAHAGSETSAAPLLAALDEVTRLGTEILDQMDGREGMAGDQARAIVGGIYRVVYDRLQGHREAELPGLMPDLWRWAMNYRRPPQELRLSWRRSKVELEGSMPPFATYDPEQRIIRAFAAVVAEKGYRQTTIADIAAAASISQTTFYAHFQDKADTMAAALDSSGAQLLAAVVPAAQRALDWPSAVRIAVRATCGFLASEPAFAHLRLVDLYAAGPEALARRDAAGTRVLQTLLNDAAVDGPPQIPEVGIEAIVGAVYSCMADQVRSGDLERLLEITPLLTYLALAPFLGAEQACEVANREGWGSRSNPKSAPRGPT